LGGYLIFNYQFSIFNQYPMNKFSNTKILSIDTSCDETSAAVTLLRQGYGRAGPVEVLSNVIWSQASQHAQFGGVMPSLAQRMHKERIDWVVERALRQAQCDWTAMGAIAVTIGPGLAMALEVGIAKAKELSKQLNIPLIPINHLEGHLLSPLATLSTSPLSPLHNYGEGELRGVRWPALGLVVSGGHTELVLIKKIGEYEILARTQDDALGEALDKAARMLGLGYPGGAVLEKMARLAHSTGSGQAYPLPLPMSRSADKSSFSYSGLKTAFYRLISTKYSVLSTQQIYDLAAAFQNRAFQHLERVVNNVLTSPLLFPSPKLRRGVGERLDLLVGGGVAANMELRKRLRKIGKEMNLKVRFPYSLKLCGDNAAMIGVAAGFKNYKYIEVDQRPRWRVSEVLG